MGGQCAPPARCLPRCLAASTRLHHDPAHRPPRPPHCTPPSQELDCVEPSITYVKSPANFTSKYHSAPS